MNSRSLIIAMVAGLALALLMFGVTMLVGNSQGWFSPAPNVVTNNVLQNAVE